MADWQDTKILLVDFDQTLFDPEAFYDDLPAPPRLMQQVYTPLSQYEEAYEGGEYAADAQAVGEYSLEAMAEDLQEQGVDVTADEIRDAFGHAHEFLYEPEALDDLDELADEYGIDEVIVVSRSPYPDWEELKIQASGVDEFADAVVVIDAELEDETKIDFLLNDRGISPDNVFLVDDTAEEIDAADVDGFRFDVEKNTIADAMQAMDRLRHRGKQADFV